MYGSWWTRKQVFVYFVLINMLTWLSPPWSSRGSAPRSAPKYLFHNCVETEQPLPPNFLRGAAKKFASILFAFPRLHPSICFLGSQRRILPFQSLRWLGPAEFCWFLLSHLFVSINYLSRLDQKFGHFCLQAVKRTIGNYQCFTFPVETNGVKVELAD